MCTLIAFDIVVVFVNAIIFLKDVIELELLVLEMVNCVMFFSMSSLF